MRGRPGVVVVVLPLIATALAGCNDPPPGDTYFAHYIQPVLVHNCNTTSGCHRTNADDPYDRALGNLDVTSYERITKRRDLLQTVGPYSYPPLLIKASAPAVPGPGPLYINYDGDSLPLEVAHSGGAVLALDSDAFGLLLDWISNGATETGLEPPAPAQVGDGPCSSAVPPTFDVAAAMAEPAYAQFVSDVQPILDRKGCGAATCHGAPAADFYITCGQTDAERAFNYTQTHAFVGAPVEQSQLLQVTLARDAGGIGHTGGDQFTGRDDPDYAAIRAWAELAGPMVFGAPGSPEEFFARHVQPIFIQRGCSFLNCHSPAAANDFKLRSGSQGFFSPLALARNYDLTKFEFLAPELPDARRSRVVAKNLLPDAGGIRHRAGPVLEDPGRPAATTPCPPFDPANAEASFQAGVPPGETQFSPYCTIQAWLDFERSRLPASAVSAFTPGSGSAQIVYVDRPAGAPADTPLEFDTYRPGAELRLATFALDADAHLGAVTSDVPLLAGCAGATFGATGNADIRGPEVGLDGDTIAFAMRIAAGEGLQVWTYTISTGACTRLTTPAVGNAITIDNFDPTWSPDGAWIVFASSRGGAAGPTRARSPGFRPQSDLWRMHADGTAPEQVTFLTNSELDPALMRDGRITMTTEKIYVDADSGQGTGVFHQLAGRRINWDRTDYHPLLAQRARSPYGDPDDMMALRPSMDFAQATSIRQLPDGDFAFILSDDGARGGGGALAILNRSIGPFEAGRGDADPAFVESVTMVRPDGAGAGAVDLGRLAATAAYRGAFGLHDGRILASYAQLVGTLGTTASIDWKLCDVDVDPVTGAATQRPLIARPGAQLDAVEVVRRAPGRYFLNHHQLVFGGDTNPAAHQTAYIHLPDAPMLFTLLTGNLRRGRPVDAFRRATAIEFLVEHPNTGTTANLQGIYQDLQVVGRVPLEADGSARVEAPSGTGIIMRLVDDAGVVVSMGEEHQFGPGEEISLGIREELFDAACGGCHGSVTGSELDVVTRPDVLTGASASIAARLAPVTPR